MLSTAVPVPTIVGTTHYTGRVDDREDDPLELYSRSLYAYTLSLWTESRRIVEEEKQRDEQITMRKKRAPSISSKRQDKT